MNKSRRAPWGYVFGHDGKLTASTASADRAHRAELGETAMRLLGALGIGTQQLETMTDIEDPKELLAKLQEFTT